MHDLDIITLIKLSKLHCWFESLPSFVKWVDLHFGGIVKKGQHSTGLAFTYNKK